MSDLCRPGSEPLGSVGKVVGGLAADGTSYQIMLWASGVPVLFNGMGGGALVRGAGWIRQLMWRRGQYLVLVREDPERFRAGPAPRVWSFGPWDKSEALIHQRCLEKAIDDGVWVPLP